MDADAETESAEVRFGRAVEPFDEDPRVGTGTGFGGAQGRRLDGRIFAMLAHGELVVKLPSGRVDEIVDSGLGRHFDAGKGRPMREWVSVPIADPDPWPALVAEAYAFAATRRG